MKIEIQANDYNALLATSGKDDIRYYLNGIFIDADQICAVATDGHALLRAPITFTDETDRIPSFILPRLATKAPANGSVSIDTEKRTASYLTAKGIQRAVYQYAPIDGKYPDYLSVIPDLGSLQTEFKVLRFNPELISRTIAPLKLFTPGVIIKATDATGSCPMVVCIHGREDLTFVVMPMRF